MISVRLRHGWLRVCLLGRRENFVEWHAAFLEQMRAQGKWVEKEQPPGLTVRRTPQHPKPPAKTQPAPPCEHGIWVGVAGHGS